MEDVALLKAAQLVHINLHRSHGACAACRSRAAVCTARSQKNVGGSCISACPYASVHVYVNRQSIIFRVRCKFCYSVGNKSLTTCFKLASPGTIVSKPGCFSVGCQPVPHHLIIAWIKLQALAQSCSSCVPVTHCQVSHSQPKNTQSQTAVAMHAYYLLAARLDLQQITVELEPNL